MVKRTPVQQGSYLYFRKPAQQPDRPARPIDHVAVAMSHLDRIDLQVAHKRIGQLGAVNFPVQALLDALQAAVYAEIHDRQSQPFPDPPMFGIFGRVPP